MSPHDKRSGEDNVLARGPNFTIHAAAGYLRCEVVNTPDITPQAGARGAALMDAALSRTASRPDSPFRGVLFDVQQAPRRFGPKTRESLLRLFKILAACGWRIAIVTGDAPIQKTQFEGLCAECAPESSAVFDDHQTAAGWIGRQRRV